jgi:hypothetical protein
MNKMKTYKNNNTCIWKTLNSQNHKKHMWCVSNKHRVILWFSNPFLIPIIAILKPNSHPSDHQTLFLRSITVILKPNGKLSRSMKGKEEEGRRENKPERLNCGGCIGGDGRDRRVCGWNLSHESEASLSETWWQIMKLKEKQNDKDD